MIDRHPFTSKTAEVLFCATAPGTVRLPGALSDAVRLVGGWLRKQVAHGPRLAAEKIAEQRVDAGEVALVGGLIHAEGEAKRRPNICSSATDTLGALCWTRIGEPGILLCRLAMSA